MLCVLIFVLSLGMLVGSVILRAACSLMNKISSNSVPEPVFGTAIGIVVTRFLATIAVSVTIGVVVGPMIGGIQENIDMGVRVALHVISLGISIVVGSVVIMSMLPTDYGKAILISLLEFGIKFCIGLVLGFVVIAVMHANGGLNW